MKNILITTSTFSLDYIENPASKAQQLNFILNPKKRKLTQKEVIELILAYQPTGIIAGVEPLTSDVFKLAKNLRVISRCGIGLNSVDTEAAKNYGITVTNTPDAPTIAVAELTIALILNLIRRINISDRSIRNKKWERPMGHLLCGKTIGIIGCGRIGSCVAKRLSSFECKLLGFDLMSSSNNENSLLSMVTLDELLSSSDIITLHIPYTKENDTFFNSDRIKQLKNNALIVNTARGGLIDEDALYDALVNSNIAGAALDCFDEEPYTGKLSELNNVVLTAHIGSYAKEARLLMEQQALNNLLNNL